MREHLTLEEIEKYIDNSEPDAAYLRWFTKAEEHLQKCECCAEQVQNFLMVDSVCDEDESILTVGLHLMAKEYADRRKNMEKLEETEENNHRTNSNYEE